MKTAGIICEFNPFHEGHKYLIDKAREAGAERIVCVMSGDFVQRGQPAISDKFDRAQAAVDGGADLILELPCIYAVNSADYFARGGIRILRGLGCIDTLVFGSECGDIDILQRCARQMLKESESFSEKLRELLSHGESYPYAYQSAASEVYSKECADLLDDPNNTLALCYLREIMLQKADMQAWTVKRSFPFSGTRIRDSIRYQDRQKYFDERLFAVVRSRVLSSSVEQIAEICETSEGLEHRIVSALENADGTDSYIREIKSSRYTYAKVSRILMQLLLGITKEIVKAAEADNTAYAKVLAFNENGAEILRLAREKGSIPVISNINKNISKDSTEKRFIDIDINSSDLYSILCGRTISEYSDRVRIPVIINNKEVT